MPRLVTCWLAALAFSLPARASDSERGRTVESRIAEGLALITIVSSETPYVGEQVSFAYRLRTTVPLDAIDVDPQSFDGFWTTIVPVSEIEGGASNSAPGRDLLLRHVVAWPLRPGKVPVAPLRVKIRLSRRTTPAGDWDFVAESAPFELASRAVPGAAPGVLPLVGKLGVSLSRSPEFGAILLEANGTANLSFFDPRLWLTTGGYAVESMLLVQADEIPQRVFRAGSLQLNLLQRRRWQLAMRGDSKPTAAPRLPCFDPAQGKWADAAVESTLGPSEGAQAAAAAHASPGSRRRGFSSYERLALAGLAVAAILLTGAALLARRKSRRRPSTGRTARSDAA